MRTQDSVVLISALRSPATYIHTVPKQSRLIAFKNPAFARCAEDAQLVNDNMYGWSLMQFLRSELGGRGYAIDSSNAPIAEDFGWYLDFAVGEHVGVVVVYGEDDDPELSVSIEVKTKKKAFFKRSAGDDPEQEGNSLATVIKNALAAHPQTTGLR